MWTAAFQVLKKYVFEILLKRVLGTAILGGIKGLAIRFVLEKLWNKYVLPLLKKGRKTTRKVVDKVKTKKKVEKFKEAKTDEEIDDSFGNLP